MLNITLITIGKIREKYFEEAASSYIKRIKPYGRLKIEEIKAESFSDSNKDKAKKVEGERIQSILDRRKDAEIFLMSERGELFDSPSFSAKIDNKEIIFVIAGSLGFDQELENKYSKISLSPLTFPHELARVILLEQIYRAATIINNKEYHY